MTKEILIRTAEMAVGHSDAIIKTGSLGSCLAIMLYDNENRVGGMAHAMLPQSRDSSDVSNPAKYVNTAIEELVKKIEEEGGSKLNLEAKLVGGAAMFRRLSHEKHSIGFKNIELAHKILSDMNISVVSEDTGGSTGKTLQFNLSNGVVDVSTKL